MINLHFQISCDNWLYFWLFGSSESDESKKENLYGKQLIISGLRNAVGSIKLEAYYKTTDGQEYWIKPTGDDDYFTITYPMLFDDTAKDIFAFINTFFTSSVFKDILIRTILLILFISTTLDLLNTNQ